VKNGKVKQKWKSRIQNEIIIIFCKPNWNWSKSGRNWNGRVGCNSFFCLIKLTKSDFALEDELKEYEGEFERNEILDL
jgi:hypothetical protein